MVKRLVVGWPDPSLWRADDGKMKDKFQFGYNFDFPPVEIRRLRQTALLRGTGLEPLFWAAGYQVVRSTLYVEDTIGVARRTYRTQGDPRHLWRGKRQLQRFLTSSRMTALKEQPGEVQSAA